VAVDDPDPQDAPRVVHLLPLRDLAAQLAGDPAVGSPRSGEPDLAGPGSRPPAAECRSLAPREYPKCPRAYPRPPSSSLAECATVGPIPVRPPRPASDSRQKRMPRDHAHVKASRPARKELR
jgi:hypothetical protein